MRSLRLVFAGTPDFACPSLSALRGAGHEICLVITQPDRPCGRGQRLRPPAVRMEAEGLDLPCDQPECLDTPEMRRRLEELAPEAVVVVAFGQKIPPWLLSLPPLGCLNVHASLLPRYRGAAPIQRALLDGAAETGVTIMRLDEGWDTGPVILQRAMAVAPEDNAGTLHEKLAAAGADLLVEALAGLARGDLHPRPQDEAGATRAPKLRPEEMRLDWTAPAPYLHNLVRALAPAPLAETSHGGRRLQIIETRPAGEVPPAPPGTVLAVEGREVLVHAGTGGLFLVTVKPANSRAMSAADYARGHRLLPGDRLGYGP